MFDTPGQGGPGAPDNGNPGTPPAATPPGSTPPGAGGGDSDLFAGMFSDSPPPSPKPGEPPAATPPATPPTTPPAEKPAPAWLEKLPEDMRKHPALQDKESPADVLKDYLKLKDAVGDFKPLEKPEELNLKLPETLDPKLANQNGELDWLAKKAVEFKFSAEQTQKVFDAFLEYRTMEWNQANAQGQAAIKDLWGKDFDANKDAVGKFMATVSSRMGPGAAQRLDAWVRGNPSVGSSPVFAELALFLAKSISPEAMPGNAPGSAPTQAMSTVDFIIVATGWTS